MEFKELLHLVSDLPVFETGLLLAGVANPDVVRVQLSRWVASGRLYRLRRGLYALAPPYRLVEPHPFFVANALAPGSYVSLQSALAHYALIPEYVAVTTSVGTRGPKHWETPLGDYEVRHLKADLFWGYVHLEIGGGRYAFVAHPEKALLDLVHLQAGGDAPEYLRELRLQNLERLDLNRLGQQAARAASPKLRRAVQVIKQLAQAEAEYEML